MPVSVGFFISATVFYVLNVLFPVPEMDQIDDLDVYGTFTPSEARRARVMSLDEPSTIIGKFGAENSGTAAEHGAGQKESEKNV
jgi:NCS1 family nucleobase:cation symporter-1